MTFSRVNPGGWALYEVLTSAQMNALDINMTRALDGYGGGNYEPSSDLSVWGKIIGENVAERVFLYPLTAGHPDDGTSWKFGNIDPAPGAGWGWETGTSASEFIYFSLGRFIPDTGKLKKVRAYVYPGAVDSGTDRMYMALYVVDYKGDAVFTTSQYDISYYPYNTIDDPEWITTISGYHTGADNQSVMTDSFKNWQVDQLVGLTIVNETDFSSGVITANTATTVTATLSGGIDNDWDTDDDYTIEMDLDILGSTRNYFMQLRSSTSVVVDGCSALEVTYSEGDYLAP